MAWGPRITPFDIKYIYGVEKIFLKIQYNFTIYGHVGPILGPMNHCPKGYHFHNLGRGFIDIIIIHLVFLKLKDFLRFHIFLKYET